MLEIGCPLTPASAPNRYVATHAELEMAIIQRSAPEQLAGRAATAEPSRGDAIEQFSDRPPLARRYARIEGRMLRQQPCLAPSRLHSNYLLEVLQDTRAPADLL